MRILITVTLVAAITVAHYGIRADLTSRHDLLQRCYYVPIILSGLWFGPMGALITSGAISIIYVHHIHSMLGGAFFGENLERTLEIVLYNVVAAITGLLAQREAREHARYRETAEALDRSYKKLDAMHERLKTQTGALIEVDEQLRKTDRLSSLGELSASLAHEIRNPLGAIEGATEILSDRFQPQDREYRFALILKEEVRRLNGVVSRFLSYAKMPGESADGHCSPSTVIGEVLKLASPGLRRAGLRLVVAIDPDLPDVSFDPEQLKQVLLNIMLNSQAAMGPGGSLTITASLHDGHVRVVLADTGHGVSTEHMGRLFEPFFTTREEGTGLGLAIVKRMTDRFQAKVSIESTPGRGTAFTIDLRIASHG